ncbi:MAG: hypothetical protein AAB923_01130 [Patescibacteria group bacterium]
MFLKVIEKIRKQPLHVRRQVMILTTIVIVMLITLAWAVGFVLIQIVFKEPSAPGSGFEMPDFPDVSLPFMK